MKYLVSYGRDLKKSLSLSHLLTIQFCQSFAFYGLRSSLVLFLTQELGLSDISALRFYGTFMGFLYLTPLVGGVLIDRYWSAQVSMIWGICATLIGTIFITIPHTGALFFGGAFIIVGQGFFKPVVPFLLDEAYKKSGSSRESSYTLYYIMINVGGALSPLLCGWVRHYYGWRESFVVMVAMGILGLFLVRKVRTEDPERKLTFQMFVLTLLTILLSVGLFQYILRFPKLVDQLVLYSLPAMGLYLGYLFIQSHERIRIFFVGVSILIVILFVSMFEQSGGSMTLFLERHVNRSLWGDYLIPTSTFQSLNPFLIIIFGVSLSFLGSKMTYQSRETSALLRLSLGFLLTMFGFGLLWFVSASYPVSAKVSAWWVVSALALHTLGELCIIPLTLSLITHLAPQSMKGTAIGLWSLSIAYGHYLAAWLSRFVIHSNEATLESFTSFQHVFGLTAHIALYCLVILIFMKLILKYFISKETMNIIGNYKL